MVRDFAAGHYRFIPSVFQYSAGVAALPGYEIARVRFMTPVPLADGFARVERYITDAGRPMTAFCACELRSPAPFTDDGFYRFNKQYVETLTKWGLFDGTTNPVARSNVCPQIDPPAEPSFFAFCFTRPSADTRPTFVLSGSAETRDGEGPYSERVVRYGDTSAEGMREKTRQTVGEMQRRLDEFGYGWADATAAQLYTVHDFHHVFADEIVRRGAARSGLTWYFDRPPVQGLDVEMDVRSVLRETVI